MFARRHVFEHEAGVADRRYVERSGDTTVTEGTLIRETREKRASAFWGRSSYRFKPRGRFPRDFANLNYGGRPVMGPKQSPSRKP